MPDSKANVLLDSHEVRDIQTSQKYLEIGRKAEDAGDRQKAIEAYEAAFAADPDNTDVCFRLAYNLDLVGEEDEAIHLYEQCVLDKQAPLNSLLNLAVLYEDRGMYAQAERAVRQVLATDPNHPRARLYIKDIMASRGMVIDEDQEENLEKNKAVIDTPVTDFDLSVRTRNALRKMNIRTLGDLLKVSEAELCSYRNFGEGSLQEIKAMLAQRGLRLGQFVAAQQTAARQAVYDQLKTDAGTGGESLESSVAELNLSVRARKALALLGVQSIGDLCTKTEAELMGVKNFGTTSLLEIKAKLGTMGLSLRQLEG
ncbi:MAG: tetratricopeptide repeat protein [Phycisphaeraceae bacterium]|nr:tetratricopeptide repeat protein [Phycisphaeraceae bacterium]